MLWLLGFLGLLASAAHETAQERPGTQLPVLARGGSVYAGRSGLVEARDAAARGLPLSLYSHVWNGRAPGFRTPGLLNCDPGKTGGNRGLRFLPLPEANWGEPGPYPPTPDAEAAIAFATDFNRATFRSRSSDIKRACPKAGLDPYVPDKELYYRTMLIGAFNELRCQGHSAKEAKKLYERRFGARQRAIKAALLERYGPSPEGEDEVIPIGFRCPRYEGAGRRLDAALSELERRLLPRRNMDPPAAR
jgi:hypothetical protein